MSLDELDPETSAFRILVHLTFRGQPMKPIDISKDIGENSSTVRARLAELKRSGLVDAKGEGYVALTTPYDILMKLYRRPGKR
jgi:Mn-dependent DtxR family transcriptional regulator